MASLTALDDRLRSRRFGAYDRMVAWKLTREEADFTQIVDSPLQFSI